MLKYVRRTFKLHILYNTYIVCANDITHLVLHIFFSQIEYAGAKKSPNKIYILRLLEVSQFSQMNM
jgi:hypothetical protein